jgi:hypothetical protein
MRYKALPLSVRGGPARRTTKASPPSLGAPRRRLRDWVATGIMVLALPLALVAANQLIAAPRAASLEYSGLAAPGSHIDVLGRGFHPRSSVQLKWDDSTARAPEFRTDQRGSFDAVFVIPATATVGPHRLSAVNTGPRGLVEVTISVEVRPAPLADDIATTPSPQQPTASPSPTHPPHPGHEPTPAPSAPPPTPAPPAQPTAAPTPQPPAPQPTPQPPMAQMSISCDGYPEGRIFMEAQSWWTQTEGQPGTDFGHAHVGTCFPYNVQVSGVLVFDVRIKMHHNPGTLVQMKPHIETPTGTVAFPQPHLNWTPVDGTGEIWQRVWIDTTLVPYDGLQELRLWTQVREPDGNEMHVSTGWQLDLANGGRPVLAYRAQGLAMTEGRGWYTGVEYTVARFSSLFPVTVSGTWVFNVDLKPGAGGIPVTAHEVRVDSDAHAGIPGIVVKQGAGEYIGPVSIDTTQLSNGYHRLFLKADAAASSGSTNSGVMVLYFNVQN